MVTGREPWHPSANRFEEIGNLSYLCWGIGLFAGDELRCQRNSRSVLVLECGSGETLLVNRERARFIQVRSL